MNDSSLGCVYRFTSPSGKMYIGQTWNIERRFMEHEKYAKRGRGPCRALCDAFGKYGFQCFVFDVLVDGINDQDELDRLESKYIQDFNTLSPYGYNLNYGGIGGRKSDDAKKRMSASAIERCKNPEYIKMISDRMTKFSSDPNWRIPVNKKIKDAVNRTDVKEKMIASSRARSKNPAWIEKMKQVQKDVDTPERRLKQGEVSRKRWASEEGRKIQMDGIKKKMEKPGHREALIANLKKLCIPVVCLETGVRYESSTAAAKDIGFKNQCRINQVCRGTRKTAGGYTWKFDTKC